MGEDTIEDSGVMLAVGLRVKIWGGQGLRDMLDCQDCLDRMLGTGALNNKIYCFHSSEGWKSKLKFLMRVFFFFNLSFF